jgi:hypothetical protein
VQLHNLTALVVAATTFLSRSAQSLAPVVGTMLISQYCGGARVFNDDAADVADAAAVGDSAAATQLSATGDDDDGSGAALRATIFRLLVATPFLCGAVQLLAWRRFKLHGAPLRRIKRALRARSHAV